MCILKKGHQPGVYVPLRALFLVNFTARSNLVTTVFLYEKVKTVDFSSPEPKAHGELIGQPIIIKCMYFSGRRKCR